MESGGEFNVTVSPARTHHPRFQIIEGIASGSLNFVSGLLVITLSTWPPAAVPVGIFFGNTILVSSLISATASATGAHINSLITIATVFSGLCHPVRAVIYIFCQLVGGALGGTLLRVALGRRLAYETHNAGCWIDPAGEVTVWQAALIEFTAAFILLSVRMFLFISWSSPSTAISPQVLGLWSWTGSQPSQSIWRKVWASARGISGRSIVSRTTLLQSAPLRPR